MADSPFLIVGGGIAGLAAALGLARIGKSSLAFEKFPEPGGVGAGLQIGPNAVRALQWLGAWDAVAPCCVAPSEIHIRDGLTGRILQRIPLGTEFENRFGAPYRVAHRGDLWNGLRESVLSKPEISLQNNAEVTGISTTGTTLTLKSGKIFKGGAIIAADGVHSTMRNPATGPTRIRWRGQMLHRALIPMNRVPASANTDVVTLWLYPCGHVVHYAVSGGMQFNIVAAVEAPQVVLKLAFQRACKPLAEILSSQADWSLWPAEDLEPHPNWTQNKTVLIGDAAHASLPYLAQGAAMALEDACVLANAIQNDKDIRLAFQAFSAVRFGRTRAIQRKCRQLGKIYHAGGALRHARNIVLKATPPGAFLKQMAWIYDWKP